MKKAVAVFAASSIIALTATAGVMIAVDVGCNTITSIYGNTTANSVTVTVQAADKCTGQDSELVLLDKAGAVIVGLHFRIKDGTSKAFAIAVPAGDSINFLCNGSGGNCSYSLSVP
jgi:hypothetical protein